MMRVMLALPPSMVVRCRFDLLIPKTSMRYFPYPWRIAYSTSLLKKNGYDVIAVDAIAEELNREEFIARVKDFMPDLIVWETTASTFRQDIDTMNAIRKELPFIEFAASGYYATPAYKECLAGYEYVIVGECDYSILGLVEHLDGKLKKFPKGVAADGHKFVPRDLIENLDELPWPERDDLPMEKYNDPKLHGFNVVLIASRGCPWGCSFCYVPAFYGKTNYRVRNPKDVVDEMEHLWEKYRPNELYFDDDNFAVNEEHVKNICEEIIEREIKLHWNCMVDANINNNTLELMKGAGCTGITVGAESADDNVLKHIAKGITIEDVVEFVDNCRKLEIRTHVTWVLGLPYATKESDMETVRFAIDLPSDSLQFEICTPQLGTQMYEWCEKNGYFATTDQSKFLASDSCVVDQPGYGHDEVEEVHRLAGRMWYRKMLFRKPSTLLLHLYNIYRYQGIRGMLAVAAKGMKDVIS